MKKIIIALACSLVSATLVASPAATQSWVKKYVATNAPSATTYQTISDSITVDGTNYTFSMIIRTATCPSWIVLSSSVTGITNGLVFAIDGFGNACNYTNLACSVIQQSVATNWTYIVNNKTNHINVAQLDFQVGGVNYRGYEDVRNGTVTASSLTAETGTVVFRRWFVTDSIREKLITPPTTVSFWGLLFGTAYADWVLTDTWEPYGEPVLDSAGVTHQKWIAYYYWDGRNGSLEIPSLTADSFDGVNKTTVNFDINYTSEDIVGYNELYAAFMNEYKNKKEDIKKELINDLPEVIGNVIKNKDNRFVTIFSLIWNKGDFEKQIETYVDNLLNNIFIDIKDEGEGIPGAQVKETTKKRTEEDPDPPSPPSAPPVPPYYDPSCRHYNAKCVSSINSCQFICASCQTNLYTGTHHFVNEDHHCAVCDKTFKNATCGFASTRRADHIFEPPQGGTEDGCYCVHHHVWAPHQSLYTDSSYWKYDSSHHWHTNYCTTCGWGGGRADESGHNNEMSIVFKNNNVHTVSNYCMTCKRVDSKQDEEHTPFTTDPLRYEDAEDDENHWVVWACAFPPNGCGMEYMTNTAPHTFDWSTGTIVQNAEPATGHHTNVTCSASGCGYVYESASVAHTFDEWILSQNIFALDKKKCSPCGYTTNNIPHSMTYADMVHWCQNGGGHLYGAHTYNKESKPRLCTMCGRPDADTEEELNRLYSVDSHKVTGPCGCCDDVMKAYYPKGESTYEKKWADFFTCPYGWNQLELRCNCPACSAGNYGDCWCSQFVLRMFIAGSYSGPIAGSNQN